MGRWNVFRAGAVIFVLACSTSDDGSVRSSAQQLNATPALGDFVLYASNTVAADGNVTIIGGDVGVATIATAPQLSIGAHSNMDTTHTLIAPSVVLTSTTTTGDIETNALTQSGATIGNVASYPSSMPSIPSFAAPTSYGSDVTVPNNSSSSLTAGTYGALSVGGGSSISLGAGTYIFRSITLSPHATISISSAVTLDVGGLVSLGGNCALGDTTASDLAINVAASDATGDGGTTPAVSIGAHCNVKALTLAPNGTIDIAGTAEVTGAYIGQNIHLGAHAKATFASGFEPSDAGATDASSDAAHDASLDVSTDAPADVSLDVVAEAEAGPTCDPQTCNDHNACNGLETCVNNVCTSGTPPVLDDGNPCTADSCDPQNGVVHAPLANGTSCGSTNVCTGTQICSSGLCVQNPPAVVDDGNACTIDACDPQNGVSHTPEPTGSSCGSTNLCTGTQTCNSSATCVQNPPVTIDDGNPCTIDSCDPQTGAIHTPAALGTSCGSSNICLGALQCNGGGSCVQQPPAVVDDGNACTADACDPQNGVTHTPLAQGTACADNSNLCVGAYTCDSAATCTQGAAPIEDDGNPCTADACDPQTGVSHTALPSGTSCGSTNVCTGTQTCNSSATCVQNPPAVVDDGNVCTTDACDPLSGVTHTPISGCDPSPTKGNNVFETQASLLGQVIDGSGNGVTGATLSVYDLPSHTLRTDAQVVAASGGYFRIRLTQFPSSEGANSAPHHLLLVVDAPSSIRAYRDAYAHPGTAYDFGPIKVVHYDANVTNIGPAGGTATDSLNRITVVIPPGALATTIPVQVTPFVNRDELPSPLPDSTVTMYGFDLAPSGTTFAAPVTVKLSNWRSVPTNITIPVGYFNETSGEWEHVALASWTGTTFNFTTTHFSDFDANGSKSNQSGDLLVFDDDGEDPNKSQQVCGGSSIGVSNGSVRQTFALPVYQERSTPYGVTLNYDSGLAGSRKLQSSAQQQTSHTSPAVPSSGVSVAIQGSHYSAVCVPRGQSGASSSPGSCNAGSCSLGGSGVTVAINSYFGSGANQSNASLPSGTKATDVGAWLDLPDDSNGDPIAPSFMIQHAVLSAGTGSCVSGGGTFGAADLGSNPQQTTLDPGPLATIDRHVFVHHRHNSPFGAGWAVSEVNELYLDPDGDHAMLVMGDGSEEEFRPRPTYLAGPDVVPNFNTKYTVFARDRATGENFLLNSHGALAKFDASAMTFTTLQSSMTLGGGSGQPQSLAIGYVQSTRHWVYATSDGLRDFDGTNTTLLKSRTASDVNIFTQSHVAASGDLVFYTNGDPTSPVVYRTRLSDPNHTVTPITTTSGDVRLDPKGALASTVQLSDPAGLAVAADGTLFVADRRRNIVMSFALDTNGEVGPNSPVTRVIGNGQAGILVPPGDRIAARGASIDQPVFLSTWDDGTLLIGTSFGVAQYNPTSTEIEWLFFDANVNSSAAAYSDLSFTLSGGGAGVMGSILALGPTSLMTNTDFSAIYRFDVTGLASRYDPYRTIVMANGSAFLDDPVAETTEAYDSLGRMTERHRRSGEMLLSVQYVGTTNTIDKIVDPDNNATTFTYDLSSGKLTMITDPRGRTTSFTVDAFGDLTAFQEPDLEMHGFVYLGHHMTEKHSPAGDVTKYDYTSDGVVTKVTKPNGEFTTFVPPLTQPVTYSSTQVPTHTGSFTDDHGVVHNIVVNTRGDIDQEQWTADSVSYTRQAIYADFMSTPGSGAPGRHRNRLFRVSFHTLNGLVEDLDTQYDEIGRIVGVQDSTDTTQNVENRLLLTWDQKTGYLAAWHGSGADDAHTIVRDNSGRITRVFVPNGGGILGPETDYTYNRSDGQPDSVTVHGVTSNLTYDSVTNNVLKSKDTANLGITTTLTRDAYGNVASTSDGQATWTFTYDANNRLVAATDANTNTTSYGYTIQSCGCSEADRLTSIHTPDLPTSLSWALDYWPEGRLKTITDPDGHETSLAYRSTGELSQVTDANNHGALMGYDSLGRLSSAFDALGRAHTRAYPVPTSSGWSGTSVLSGSPTSTPVTTNFTTALNNGEYQIGLNLFQQKGDLAQVSFYRDATFEIGYGMTWDASRRLTYRQDRVGTAISSSTVRPTAVGQFDDATLSYNLSSSDPVVTSISSTNVPSVESASYTQNQDYDDTQVSGWGQILPSVNETLTRDAAGRITKHTHQFANANGNGTTIPPIPAFDNAPATTYTYSPTNGRLTNFTDADGSHDVFYDSRGLVSKITVSSEGDYVFGYDALGRNTTLTYPGALTRTQVYDNEGRITQRCYDGGTLNRCYAATYDAAGNPVTMTDPEGTYTFEYDPLDRLTKSTRVVPNLADEIETYDYNALGALKLNAGVTLDDQRPKLVGGGTADAAVPNTYNNQPVTLDGAGRITSLFGNTLMYNKRGRLIGAVHPTVNNTTNAEFYSHDSQMRRTGRFGVVNGAPSTTDYELFVWDGANLVASIDKTNHVNESLLYEGLDQPLRISTSGLKYYYELDLAGNVRRVRRTDGSDGGGYRYSAFGQEYAHDTQAPIVAIAQPIRWKARWWSDFTQLYDVRARWWSPQMGVFTNIDEYMLNELAGASGRDFRMDRLPLSGGVNLYTYCDNSPIGCTDPSGLNPGDPYDSRTAAAVAALRQYGAYGQQNNIEATGWITELPDGKFSYTYPVFGLDRSKYWYADKPLTIPPGGDAMNTNSFFPLCPSNQKIVASYHNHTITQGSLMTLSPTDIDATFAHDAAYMFGALPSQFKNTANYFSYVLNPLGELVQYSSYSGQTWNYGNILYWH